MTAMLFAAGLGTRLKPLTSNTPKALVKLNGKTLLEHNILKLKKAGVNTIIINVHHFSEQIKSFLEEKENFDINIIISDETNHLLDTGGGLKKAANLFSTSPYIILQNADIISNIDYSAMLIQHIKSNALATLATRKRITTRYLLIDGEDRLVGWENTKSDEKIWTNNPISKYKQVGFSGIHVISPKIFSFFPENNTFNIIQWYLQLAKNNILSSYNHTNDYWFDIGSIDKLKNAENFLNKQNKN